MMGVFLMCLLSNKSSFWVSILVFRNVFPLPETKSKFAPENRPKRPKRKPIVFQPSIFQGLNSLLVPGMVLEQVLSITLTQ